MRRGAIVNSPLLGPNVGAGLGQGAAMPAVHFDSGRLQQPPSGFCLHNVSNLPFTSTHLEGSRIRRGRRRFLPSRREVAAAIHVLVESCWNNNPLVPACVASSVCPSWFLTASPGIASLQISGRASMLSS
uniref:Uncharacterized protein n=1 Tax=Oryza rufipogon TaxID=4529 RepID=A0A0E0NS21_ORYRU